MNLKRYIIVALMGIIALLSNARSTLPTTVIGGKSYYYYEIQSRDNLNTAAQKMGVDPEDLERYNTWVIDGLEKHQHLFIPVQQNTTAASASQQVKNAFGTDKESTIHVTPASGIITYEIAPGEDIYAVAKRHNISLEGLMRLNPALKPEQYQAGQVVRVAPDSALPFALETTVHHFVLYKVRDGESFYSIARRNGITEADLQAANPTITRAKKGKNMVIPQPHNSRMMVEMKNVTREELQQYYAPRINDLYADMLNRRRNDEVNIGIILPFQLHKPTPPQQALLYSDFLKGFLIAADSLQSRCSKKVNITVYDTQHNLNVTDSILALPQLTTLDMIVAPSEPQQLARINAFGKQAGVSVFNCFSTKNEDYHDNAMVYQVNIPTPLLAENVLKWFDGQFNGYHVIFLEEKSSDEKEIFDALKSHITSSGYRTLSLRVDGELKFDDLSAQMNPGIKYVFVPSSGSKTLLKNVIKALKQAKEERFDCDLTLVGYPEYVLYLKDYQTDLQDIDTYLFSRFFNAKGVKTRDIEARYAKWFSGKPLTQVPNMMLFGFDTGLYLISKLDSEGSITESTPLHRGVQTSFRFKRDSNWGGYVNDAIDIVHFSPAHTIETIVR